MIKKKLEKPLENKDKLVQKSNQNLDTNFIHFAAIGRPHGLKGGFFLKTPDRRLEWNGYKKLKIETKSGFLDVTVQKHYLSGNALVLELDQFQSREQVEANYDNKIFVHKSEIKLNEDEILVHELLNFKVKTIENGIVGEIIGLVSYGAQENLEIKMSKSGLTVLYPYLNQYIIEIDYNNKFILVDYIKEFLGE